MMKKRKNLFFAVSLFLAVHAVLYLLLSRVLIREGWLRPEYQSAESAVILLGIGLSVCLWLFHGWTVYAVCKAGCPAAADQLGGPQILVWIATEIPYSTLVYVLCLGNIPGAVFEQPKHLAVYLADYFCCLGAAKYWRKAIGGA